MWPATATSCIPERTNMLTKRRLINPDYSSTQLLNIRSFSLVPFPQNHLPIQPIWFSLGLTSLSTTHCLKKCFIISQEMLSGGSEILNLNKTTPTKNYKAKFLCRFFPSYFLFVSNLINNPLEHCACALCPCAACVANNEVRYVGPPAVSEQLLSKCRWWAALCS